MIVCYFTQREITRHLGRVRNPETNSLQACKLPLVYRLGSLLPAKPFSLGCQFLSLPKCYCVLTRNSDSEMTPLYRCTATDAFLQIRVRPPPRVLVRCTCCRCSPTPTGGGYLHRNPVMPTSILQRYYSKSDLKKETHAFTRPRFSQNPDALANTKKTKQNKKPLPKKNSTPVKASKKKWWYGNNIKAWKLILWNTFSKFCLSQSETLDGQRSHFFGSPKLELYREKGSLNLLCEAKWLQPS